MALDGTEINSFTLHFALLQGYTHFPKI